MASRSFWVGEILRVQVAPTVFNLFLFSFIFLEYDHYLIFYLKETVTIILTVIASNDNRCLNILSEYNKLNLIYKSEPFKKYKQKSSKNLILSKLIIIIYK